jgi:hypothetical protein
MNLATYLTDKPFPIRHARKIKHEDVAEMPTHSFEYRRAQAERYNQMVLDAMVRPDMKLLEIAQLAGLGESTTRRVLNRMLDEGRVKKQTQGFAGVWSK